MALSTATKTVLNNLWKYLPGLRKESLTTKPKLGDLLDIDAKIFKLGTFTMAAAATTAVTVAGVAVGDQVYATITLPNTGGSIAKLFTKVAVTANTITFTTDVTPTNADGTASFIVVRAVTAEA
jgi:hypothetical protein